MSETSEWEPPTGWVRLSDRRWSPWLTTSGSVGSFIAIYLLYQFLATAAQALPIFDALPTWARLLVVVGLTSVTSVAVFVFLGRVSPQPMVDFEHDLLRIGRRTVQIRELDQATLVAIDNKRGTKRTATLVIKGGKAKFGVVLHEGSNSLEPESRQRLGELLRRSSVAVPVSKDDPSGRFARYNFPGSLSKEEAIAVALDPPGPGDPLPILGGTPVPDRLRRTD